MAQATTGGPSNSTSLPHQDSTNPTTTTTTTTAITNGDAAAPFYFSSSSSSSSIPLALQPGTFQSLLPMIDDIFNTLYQQTISGEKVSTALAAEQVAPKAKQLAQALETMKIAAMDLPGGHLSTEEIRKLSDLLDEQGEQRRQILRAFEERSMPLIDQLGAQTETEIENDMAVDVDASVDGEMGSGVVPSPAGR
ncbi:hypothetical protein IAT40_005750 [Kwoniella sp. CBS 6097]